MSKRSTPSADPVDLHVEPKDQAADEPKTYTDVITLTSKARAGLIGCYRVALSRANTIPSEETPTSTSDEQDGITGAA